ncbi:MAG TPA: sensor histidine kinase [Gaiellaceae bacterium]|nr:sensor histidine kinase [Gaiellaceae bacterium]
MASLLDDLPVNDFWRVPHVRARLGVLLGLLFLIGPVSDLLDEPFAAWHLAALLAGTALFVGGYLVLLPPAPALARHGDRAILLVLATLPVIAIALLLGGAPSSYVALFVYFVAAVGMLLPIRPALAIIGATALGIAIVGAVLGVSRDALAATVLTVVSIGLLMAAFGRVARANRELKATREELARLAVTEERLRIARDLHDLLGHSLSVIALKSELARRLVERDPDRAVAEIDDIQSVTREALADVRQTVQGYRRPSLADELDGARTALAAAGIDCELRDGHVELPEDVEAVLAWAVREGATNVIRHSGAQHCAIRLQAEGDRAELEIDDDGRAAPAGTPGIGLRGLRERAQRVRGEVEAGVRPDGGFRLRLTVPLARP